MHFRPPILAGVAIVTVAAAVIGLIAIADGRTDAPASAAPASPGAVPPAATNGALLATAAATTNVRAAPERFAEVVAILPGERDADLLGRTADGLWLRVAYPSGSSSAGWVPAAAMALRDGALDALPVLATTPPPEPAAADTDAADGEALPDLVISDAFLMQNGRLAIAIRNVGDGALVEALIPLNVSKTAGDIVGVLRIGPTTLAPGAAATVVTQVVVTSTGSYLLELDRADEIREVHEFNNTHRTLLIAGGR